VNSRANRTGRHVVSLALLLAATGLILLASLLLGSAGWIWPDSPGWATDRRIMLELRLPRVLAAFAAGGLLGLAGALIQVLTRNPLADPYILGISGGAAPARCWPSCSACPSSCSTPAPRSARSGPCCWSSRWPTARVPGHATACC